MYIGKQVVNKTSEADLELCLNSLIDTSGKEAEAKIAAAGGLLAYLENHRASDELLERWVPKIDRLLQLKVCTFRRL